MSPPSRTLAARVTGLAPLVLAVLAGGVLVVRAGAAATDVAQYLAFVLIFVTFPGTVLWRRVWTGERGGLFEQAVFGTLLGLVVQVPVYLFGVFVGLPRLTAAMPVLAVVALMADRRDRARRAGGPDRAEQSVRTPLLLTWATSVVLVYAVAWETRLGYAIMPRWGPGPADPTGDQQFQLALTTELRHHVPPTYASIDGLPLQYHYFVNTHLASASWWVRTPDWILQDRLLLPVMVALVLAAVGLITYRWTGSGTAGALAVVVLGLVGDFSPFRWSTVRSNFDERFLAYFDPISPSLQFSIALLMLMLHVSRRLLTAPKPVRRDWVLFVLVTAILPGAKGSAIAVAVGGMLFVLALALLGRLDGRRRIATMAAVVVAVFVLSQLVMFRGAAAAMAVAPLDILGYVALVLGLAPPGTSALPLSVSLFAAVGLLLSWACSAAGSLGLLRARGWRDPSRLLPLGMGAAGIVAALTFGNPHLAQDYFARTSAAPFAIASATGIWWLLRGSPARVRRLTIGAGLVLGLVATLLASTSAPRVQPAYVAGQQRDAILVMLRPYLVVGALVLVVAVASWLLLRSSRLAAPVAMAVVLCTVIGLGLARVPGTLRAPERRAGKPTAATASIGRGGAAAAGWLRDHSKVDDVVATNAHYRNPGGDDNRHFWIAALTERRVHLEGWGYTPQVGKVALDRRVSSFYVPYWNPAELAANDRAFTDPDPASLDALRRHGVRWLVVDKRFDADVPALRRETTERFERGEYVVLELEPA